MVSWQSVKVFFKAQISALCGGLSDYGLMILFTELVHIHFAISILISGTLGGIVNFCINRYWAFKSGDDYNIPAKKQFLRFFGVVVGSITLKSAGTFMLHKSFNIDYRIGRLLIDSLVSYGFNYPLMKFWVFSSYQNKEKSISVLKTTD